MSKSDLTPVELAKDGLRVQIIGSGIFILFICIVVSVLFASVLGMNTRIERFVLTLMWISLPLCWVGGSLLLLKKWRKSGYFYTKDSLIVRKATLFGSIDEMYRFDSMLSVQVRQGPIDKKGSYGTVVINIPKLGKDVVLHYVKNPQDQALKLKNHIGKFNSGTSTLIS